MSPRPVSVSGNGVVWNELTDVDNVQGQGGFTVFWAQDPTPVAGAVTVTVTGNSRPVSVVGQRFGGVDPAGPIEAFSTNAGPLSDNNDMLESVTTISPEAWVVGAAWHRGRTLSLPAGETEIAINELAGSGGSATRASMWYQGPNPDTGQCPVGRTRRHERHPRLGHDRHRPQTRVHGTTRAQYRGVIPVVGTSRPREFRDGGGRVAIRCVGDGFEHRYGHVVGVGDDGDHRRVGVLGRVTDGGAVHRGSGFVT